MVEMPDIGDWLEDDPARGVRDFVDSVKVRSRETEAERVDRIAPAAVAVEMEAEDVETLDFEEFDDGAEEIARERLRSGVEQGAQLAMDWMLSALTPGEEMYDKSSSLVKVKIAQDLLDREGSQPRVQRSETRTTSVHLSSAELAQITGRGDQKRIGG